MRKKAAGLDGWGSGVRERKKGRVGYIGEWGKGERTGKGWMDR